MGTDRKEARDEQRAGPRREKGRYPSPLTERLEQAKILSFVYLAQLLE